MSTILETLNTLEKDISLIGDYLDASVFENCSNKESLEGKAEILAFSFWERYPKASILDPGLSFFGSIAYGSDNETINSLDDPLIKLITIEIMNYWERRISESKNIRLLERYSGLVWDLKKYITGIKPSFQIVITYINAINEIVDSDLVSPICSINKCSRAILISKTLNNKELLARSKQTMTSLVDRHGKMDSPGIWWTPYKIMTNHPSIYSSEEKEQIIIDLRQRFDNIYITSISSNADTTRSDPWQLMELADSISEFYRKEQRTEEITPLFEKVEECFAAIEDDLTSLQLIANYRNLQELALKNNLRNLETRLSIKIEAAGKKVLPELNVFSSEFEINKEELDAYIDSFFEVDKDLVIPHFILNFVPNKQEVEKNVRDSISKFPLLYIGTNMLLDENGRVKSQINGIDSEMNGHIIIEMSRHLQIDQKKNHLLKHTLPNQVSSGMVVHHSM